MTIEEHPLSPPRKAAIREKIWDQMKLWGLSPAPHNTIPTFPGQNKAAEKLRSLEVYRQARTIMVPPDRAQLQVRINALLDGKQLIMATPGLRDGFYLLDKRNIKVKDWKSAARSSGVRRFGRNLETSRSEIGEVDCIATGAVAVGLQGERMGKGSGYFDLEYLILREIGSVTETTPICVLVDDCQVIEQVPMETQDVAVDFIITPSKVISIERALRRPAKILWHELSERIIKGMRPLRELREKNEGQD